MEYEIDFYEFREKLEHIFDERIGIFYLRTDEMKKKTTRLIGLEYSNSFSFDGYSNCTLRFTITDKEKFLWARMKYGL